jgi:hypothetical protein
MNDMSDGVLLGRIDVVDRTGHRLMVGGMVFMLRKDVSLAGLVEGAVVKVRYSQTAELRVATSVDRIGLRPVPDSEP